MMKGAGGSNEGAGGAERERSPRRGGAPAEAGEGKGAAIGAIPRRPPSAYVGHAEKGKIKKGSGKKGIPTSPMDRINSLMRGQLQLQKLTVVEQPPPGGVLMPNAVLTPEGVVHPELEISTPGRRWAGRVVGSLLGLLPSGEENIGAALIAEAAGGQMRGGLGTRIKEEAASYVDATYRTD